jgi:hypothetical protein
VVPLTVRNADGASQTLWQGFTLLAPPDSAPPGDGDADGLPDAWETAVGLDPQSAAGPDGVNGDPDADGLSNTQEHQQQTHPRGAFTRFLAEGATNTFFTTTLGPANGGAQPVHAWLRFQKSDGTQQIPLGVTIPAQQGHTITVNALSGLGPLQLSPGLRQVWPEERSPGTSSSSGFSSEIQ